LQIATRRANSVSAGPGFGAADYMTKPHP